LHRPQSQLDNQALRDKVSRMDARDASNNLQVIRTLMERAAVYRRALAPITLYAGTLGVLAAALGLLLHWDTIGAFAGLWLSTAVLAVAGAFLIARRQAFKDHEPFWSPPTRRVAQAMLPPLLAGLCLGLTLAGVSLSNPVVVTFIWLLFYGCALHAAGFFTPRGLKWFGWLFIAMACLCLLLLTVAPPQIEISAHWLMGFFFGVLHLAYGLYLQATEKRKPVA
jgi:hypothetical protein